MVKTLGDKMELPIILSYDRGAGERRPWLVIGLIVTLACAGYYVWQGLAHMPLWHLPSFFIVSSLSAAYALLMGIFGYPGVTWTIDRSGITRHIAYRWGIATRTWTLSHMGWVRVSKCPEAYEIYKDGDRVADENHYRVEIRLKNGTWLKLLPMPEKAQAEALADAIKDLIEEVG